MSRLIDADVLKEEIKSLQVTVTGLRAGKGILNEYAKQYRESLLRIIDEQPTAYDVENVVEELEKEKEVVKEYDKYYHAVRIEKAINIVKRGGVE